MRSSWHHSVVVEDLHAGYGSNENYMPVLNAVSFTATPGKLICLMGPNGAGKSTLLRCISGLQAYHSGKVIIKGNPIATISAQILARTLAVVLTDPVAVPNLTVRELLSMGRYPHLGWMLKFSGEDEEIIENTASDCGITHLLDKHVQSLSDGQRQKVLIGRALAQETDILILDEPTSHLDLNNRVEIINLLRKFTREKHKTIIMATHELDLALQMADRLLLLDANGTMKQGIPEDLVLNGELDKVFAFKGYDLKTGKVVHPVTGRTINLQGNGYIYLWTKNALEREGLEVSPSATETIYTNNEETPFWRMEDKKFQSLEELVEHLKNEKGR